VQEQKNGPGFSSSSWEEILIPVRKEEEKKYTKKLYRHLILSNLLVVFCCFFLFSSSEELPEEQNRHPPPANSGYFWLKLPLSLYAELEGTGKILPITLFSIKNNQVLCDSCFIWDQKETGEKQKQKWISIPVEQISGLLSNVHEIGGQDEGEASLRGVLAHNPSLKRTLPLEEKQEESYELEL